MKRWQPPVLQRWSRPWHGLSRLGGAGALALLLAVPLAAWITPRWQHAAEQAVAAAAASAALQRQASIAQADRQRSQRGQSQATQAWPAAAEREARVARLLQLAQERGVAVRAVRQEAAAAPVVDGAPHWHVVALSLEGPYGRLRQFIADALQADPALALDALLLQREDGKPGPLRAELTWALASAAR
jgi:hypothetical protein